MVASETSEAASTPPILDEEIYDVLAKVIGSEKAAQLARRFSDDLTKRFREVTDLEQLRADAHKVISSAGMLGFSDLSACARELELACERPRRFGGQAVTCRIGNDRPTRTRKPRPPSGRRTSSTTRLACRP
jgi:hypothetical protein